MGKHSANRGGRGSGGGDTPPSRRRRPVRRAVPSNVRNGQRLVGPKPRPGVADDDYSLSDPRSRRRGPLESAPERLRAERERRKKRNKRTLAVIAASVVGVLLAGAVGVWAYAQHLENTMQGDPIIKQEKLALNLKKAAPQEPYNMLLVGYDRRPGETLFRTDSMILARVNPKTKEVWLLSIPRDTKVLVPGHGTQKVNNAFFLGKTELAIKTVENFTGQDIHHFMAINFEGFESAVDAMGGVWIDVPTEINDKKADRSPNHRAAHVDAGYQKLDGEHALTFVRSRDYPDADITRMKNQQAFFKAFADQVAKNTGIAEVPGIVSSLAPYISTDMSLMEMLRTAQALRGAGSKRIYTSTIGGEWKSPYIITDEEKKAELLAKFEAGEPFEKPASSEASGTATATATATSNAKALKPSQITITVRNGAGIAGCAKQAASILKAQGFKVEEVGNAGQFVYDKTTVVYNTDKPSAALVASTLPPGSKLVQSRGMYSFKTRILVVIGKNWDVSKVPVAPIRTN